MPTLDKLCALIQEENEQALTLFLDAPEIKGIVQDQVRYFLIKTSDYTEGELKAILQNTVWRLIKDKFRLPSSEHQSGKTVLTFLVTNLGQYVYDYIYKVDKANPIPPSFSLEVETIFPSMYEQTEEKERREIQKAFIESLLTDAKEKGILAEEDIAVLMLRHTDKNSFESIARKCTAMFHPKSPYTKGWASARYNKALNAVRSLVDMKGGEMP